MDFATMGQALARNEGVDMQVVTVDGGTPLFAVKDEQGKWSVTVDAEAPGAVPCLFKMVGQDSRAYRRRKHELVDALRARQKTIKSQQIEEESLKLVAAGVVGWSNIPWEGALLDFSDENLLRFLDNYRPAFDQANEFIGDRTRFLKIA